MKLDRKKIAVIGDLILDRYLIGSVDRISPEAPVPILKLNRREEKAGGSGNVAVNLRSLGMDVDMFGRVGEDKHGEILTQILKGLGVGVQGVQISQSLPTISKNRMIASNQQMLRVDEEVLEPCSSIEIKSCLAMIGANLDDYDALIISDYGKGYCAPPLLSELIRRSRVKGIPVIIDPKGDDYSIYRGATVITPNRKEAEFASRCRDLTGMANYILEVADLEFLLVTLSQDGIGYFRQGSAGMEQEIYPVQVQDVIDVTGAGDTVVAVAAMALANGIDHPTLCRLCNEAAGEVVGHFGAASISMQRLLQRMGER